MYNAIYIYSHTSCGKHIYVFFGIPKAQTIKAVSFHTHLFLYHTVTSTEQVILWREATLSVLYRVHVCIIYESTYSVIEPT